MKIIIIFLQSQKILNTEPFAHPIISDLIRSQWFGRGKADGRTFNKMVGLKEIPGEVIILVVSVVRIFKSVLAKYW